MRKLSTPPALFIPNGEITIVRLDAQHAAMIDTEDLPKVVSYTWFNHNASGRDYAWTNAWVNEKRRTLYMHRLIMDCLRGEIVDHINHNGLDNRKRNLRKCSHKENLENREKATIESVTQVRGVFKWTNNCGRDYWCAQIRSNGCVIVRRFSFTEEGFIQAKKAAEDLRKEYFTHSTN